MSEDNAHIIEYLTCKISCVPLFDPITASDGFTYNRDVITLIMNTTKTSPMTRSLLSPELYENLTIKHMLFDYIQNTNIFDHIINDLPIEILVVSDVIDKLSHLPKFEKKILELYDVTNTTLLFKLLKLKKIYTIIDVLTKTNATNINKVDDQGNTLLTSAVINKNQSFVRRLLTFENIDVNVINNAGHNAIFIACNFQMYDIFCDILNHKNMDINKISTTNYSIVHFICSNNMTKYASKLFSYPELNINKTYNNRSPFIIACDNNFTEIASIILNNNNFDSNNEFNLYSVLNNRTCRNALLIQYVKHPKININLKLNGFPLIFHVITKECIDVFNYLIDRPDLIIDDHNILDIILSIDPDDNIISKILNHKSITTEYLTHIFHKMVSYKLSEQQMIHVINHRLFDKSCVKNFDVTQESFVSLKWAKVTDLITQMKQN